MKQELSILIPVYNGDCRSQVEALSRQAEAIGGLRYEIIVADDGSTDRRFTELCREVERLPHCRFVDRKVNSGRSAIRNFLAREALFEWLLFMDAELDIESPQYVQAYLTDESDAPVVYGGCMAKGGEPGCLRFLYEQRSMPQHTAEERCKRPFMHFRTCNFLVRRSVILAHPFDERFRYYGYEDVLWGKRLRQAGIRIGHIDNPIAYSQYEDNTLFVSKTEEALRTLHLFRDDLRGYSKMITFAEGIHIGLVRHLIRLAHRLCGPLVRKNLCSKHPCLRLFNLYKLGYYLSLKG